MKVLVIYFSQTGNTEQIAKAIHQEAQFNDAVLLKPEETNVSSVSDYDLVFLGTPIHAGWISANAKEFLESFSGSLKLAGFVTHASPAFEKTSIEVGLKTLDEITKEKGIKYLGCFDCQGRLIPELHDIVKLSRGLSDEEWSERMAQSDPHPNSEDEGNAKAFAKDVLSKA